MTVQIFNCEQGSPEWFAARLGIPTASNFAKVLAKGEGKTRREYLLRLAGEVITGELSEKYTNEHMERGKVMEAEARNLYAMMREVEPQQVGFIRNDKAGASPDSLLGDTGLLEIKTKLPHLQLAVLESDKLPPEHKAQVQGQLWIAEREWCDFASYWPRLPIYIVRVQRDEPYIKALETEVDAFLGELAELTTKYGVAA